MCTFVHFVSLRYPSELADRLRAKSTDKTNAAKRVKFGDNYEDPEDAGLLSEQALLDIGDANDGEIYSYKKYQVRAKVVARLLSC